MLKRIIHTQFNTLSLNLATLLLRLTTGSFMLTHGFPKLERLLAGEFRFSDPIGLGSEVSLVLVVFAEFFCSILIILGMGTRLAVIPLIVTMAVAAFIAHGADPFGRKELALFYLAAYVVLLLTGSGKISLDSILSRKK